MVRILLLIDRTIHGFHIGRMQDMIDTEPKIVLIVRGSHAHARICKGITQGSLNGTMCIGNRRIVEIATNQQIAILHLLNGSCNGFSLFRTNLESITQFFLSSKSIS